MSGKVYFVSAPGRIKIGYTRFPERRLVTLRRADMEELTVIAIIDGSRELEGELHQRASEHRNRGEWFHDRPEVRELIARAVAGEFRVRHVPPKPLPTPIMVPAEDSTRPLTAEELDEISCVKRPGLMKACLALAEEAEASLARGDNKYEVRGRVDILLRLTDQLLGAPVDRT